MRRPNHTSLVSTKLFIATINDDKKYIALQEHAKYVGVLIAITRAECLIKNWDPLKFKKDELPTYDRDYNGKLWIY